MDIHEYSPGDQINPRNRLIINGAHVRDAATYYSEVVSVFLMHPDWEARRFILEPPSYVGKRLLDVLATMDRGSYTIPTAAYPFPHSETGKLVAVVVHQQGYKAYDSLYTYRLRP